MYSKKPCKIILVARDVAVDVKYLTELGFNVTQMISDCIDTSDFCKTTRREVRQSVLNTLLFQYDIAGKHLHNAGNDSSYTLRVMIAIALANYWVRYVTYHAYPSGHLTLSFKITTERLIPDNGISDGSIYF